MGAPRDQIQALGAAPTPLPTRAKARRSRATDAGIVRPHLKWPGGKFDLGAQLAPLFPDPSLVTGVYRETFCGAGGMAYRWAIPAHLPIVLTDTEPMLIDTYIAIRDDVDEVLRSHASLCIEGDAAAYEARFYVLRDLYNDPIKLTRIERAALFLYIHRACFNGLHRVDSKGRYNASYGDLTGAPVLDETKLRACSLALAGGIFEVMDFEASALRASPGDLVYFDPPYDGTWVGYQAGGFTSTAGTDDCQIGLFTRAAERPALLRLRDVCAELSRRGVLWAMSNADTTEVRRLFGQWKIDVVKARSSIGQSAASRVERAELLVRNF